MPPSHPARAKKTVGIDDPPLDYTDIVFDK